MGAESSEADSEVSLLVVLKGRNFGPVFLA